MMNHASSQVAYFQRRLEKAMERVRLVLARERQPVFASETHHAYEDKYLVAEFVTNAAIASQLNSLELLGLSEAQLAKMCEWAHGGSAVSLRFRSEETCTYLREETRDVEDPRKHVEELSVGGVAKAAWTSKVVTKVTEYFWKFEVSYKLEAFRGVGAEPADRLEIQAKTSGVELKTTVKETPRPAKVIPACEEEANVTALVKLVPAGTTSPGFKIDRAATTCKTPCWNPQVEEVQEYTGNLQRLFACVGNYLEDLLEVQPDSTKKVDVRALGGQGPLVLSVAPFLKPEGSAEGAAPGAPEQKVLVSVSTGSGRLLAPGDTNLLLAEEARHLRERLGEARKALPSGDGVCNGDTGAALLVLRHGQDVCDLWRDSLSYIEDLLRKQLCAAIGKEVTVADFAEYMRFHNRKLFSEAYLPKPFCFAVRRSNQHAPEGTLSIEQENQAEGGGSRNEPIVSMVAAGEGGRAMRFPINASTNVEFTGERYLHAWLNHTFMYDDGTSPMQLVARARQFSSMLVLVGRIASATVFEPKHAAIIQNKDELKIPLELSTIPTPKEFKDAIESLSPEQQAFAKAFRSMQLESTLFGVLVIHIKPQLEKVLRLSPDSLTKEIKLTQDLMQLFIKYQIPSDLLSYDASSPDGSELVGSATPAERLSAVKEHVKAMQEMIEASKKEEIQERTLEARFANPINPVTIQAQRGSAECDLLGFADVPTAVPQAMCFGAAPAGACFGGGFGGAALGGAPPPPPMAGMMMPMGMAAPSSQMLLGCNAPVAYSAAPMPCMAPAPCMSAAPPADLSTVMFAQPMMVQEQAQVCSRELQCMDGFEVVTGMDMPEPAPGPPPREEDASPTQGGSASSSGAGPIMDYTQVPKEMDKKFEALDTDSALRPTIINVGDSWQKSSQKALLAPPRTEELDAEKQKEEKNAAFDLLDALTKSGALPVEHAALHVVVAATHCFDKSVADTVIQDSINPIEKVERSTLIMATTIHRQPAAALVQPAQLARLKGTAPTLFLEDAA